MISQLAHFSKYDYIFLAIYFGVIVANTIFGMLNAFLEKKFNKWILLLNTLKTLVMYLFVAIVIHITKSTELDAYATVALLFLMFIHALSTYKHYFQIKQISFDLNNPTGSIKSIIQDTINKEK